MLYDIQLEIVTEHRNKIDKKKINILKDDFFALLSMTLNKDADIHKLSTQNF